MANKEQRKINRFVRRYNKALAKDEFLGTNRFSMKQVSKNRDFDGFWFYIFELRDNKTGDAVAARVNAWDVYRVLPWGMNDFIIDIRGKEGW